MELAGRVRHRVAARADREDRRPEPPRRDRCFPSGSPRWIRAFPAAGWRSARCTRSPAAATARSTAPRRRSSPPASPRARRARCCGASRGPICSRRRLAQAGLAPDRVIYVEAGDDRTVLACMEEGLRHGGLGAVVAEVARLSMTASRRLQLAAEGTGAIGIALRRWRRQTEATDFGQPTAAMTRWRVSVLPSTPLPVPGRRAASLAGRADPSAGRRECGFRAGGVR